MLENLSEAICSPFAEILNYELCLWLTNILILLRFKILALSPNPSSSKIFLYFLSYKLGWILDMWLVPICPPHSLFSFSVVLLWKVISQLSSLLCQKSSSFRSHQSHMFLLALCKTNSISVSNRFSTLNFNLFGILWVKCWKIFNKPSEYPY